MGTLSAAAILPSVWRDGVSRPDSICDTMLGVNSAFSASWRCWSCRSPRRALIRSPRVIPRARRGRDPMRASRDLLVGTLGHGETADAAQRPRHEDARHVLA